jgi:ribonuclease T1
LSNLPVQAQQTWQLIERHGPYPYAQDGVVFGNLEKQLPSMPRGFYHEYTVTTPGSDDRGARRLITGQGGQLYYTADHYASFVMVYTSS